MLIGINTQLNQKHFVEENDPIDWREHLYQLITEQSLTKDQEYEFLNNYHLADLSVQLAELNKLLANQTANDHEYNFHKRTKDWRKYLEKLIAENFFTEKEVDYLLSKYEFADMAVKIEELRNQLKKEGSTAIV